MTDDLRIGVVGAGAIAQVAHLGLLSRLKGVELAGLCDIDLSKAQALASRFGIPSVFDDIEDLLRYAKPDAVLVCTPNHLHEIHVQTALSAGAHVLCERPLATSVAGIENLREVARRAGRVVMVGMNYRFRSDVQVLRGFLKGGELGAVTAVRAGWYILRPLGAGAGWRERRAESGGGAMLDLGLPLVDLALWLVGCPNAKLVTAAYRAPERSGVEDAACALIVCEGNLSLFVDVSWRHVGQHEQFWFELTGREGSAALGPIKVFKMMNGVPMNVTPVGTQGREDALTMSYRAEWAHFLATVRGEVPPPTLDDQVALHRTMEAIARSAAEGRAIEL